jgi:hypothetical protein
MSVLSDPLSSLVKSVGSAALFTVLSCGGGLRRIGASSDDYADYRAFRVAPTPIRRLTAAALYLRCHADGAFHDEVADWFDRVESLFFEAAADSAAGMQAYLDALPGGPHADSAAQRRDALLAAARAEAGERLAARGAEIERRLATAAQTREDLLTAYASWVGRLLDFDAWGRAPGDANPDFASAWASNPQTKCESDRCSKLFSMRYELEVRGKPEPFVGILEVSLGLSNGRVIGGSISGPDLFSRLAEAHDAEPLARTEEGRSRAVKYVVELTSGALERRLGRARCGRDAAPPVVMLRECDGLRVELVPKGNSEEEDRVVFRGPGGL